MTPLLLSFESNNWEQVDAEALLCNSALLQGLGLIETMRVHRDSIPLSYLHLERLNCGMQLFDWPQIDMDTWRNLLHFCIKKLKVDDGVLRLQFTVSLPNNIRYVLVSFPDLVINTDPVALALYSENTIDVNCFSNLKHSSRALYSLAINYARKHQLFDVLLANSFGNWVETSICNFFWIKDGQFYTPPLSDGCINGVMRSFLINKASDFAININEQSLTDEVLFAADGCFLTNAVRGVIPVSQINNTLYKTTAAVVLQQKVNEVLFPEINLL